MLRKVELLCALVGEVLGARASALVALRLRVPIESGDGCLTDGLEVETRRDRHEMLPADRASAALDAPLSCPVQGRAKHGSKA